MAFSNRFVEKPCCRDLLPHRRDTVDALHGKCNCRLVSETKMKTIDLEVEEVVEIKAAQCSESPCL